MKYPRKLNERCKSFTRKDWLSTLNNFGENNMKKSSYLPTFEKITFFVPFRSRPKMTKDNPIPFVHSTNDISNISKNFNFLSQI